MNVAVIGSNGFIGKHLTEKLIESRQHSVLLFGRSPESVFGRTLPYQVLGQIKQDQVAQQFREIDVVYYLASSSIPASSWDNPLIEIEQNLTPFINLLEGLSKTNVKKFSFISSGGTIYGTGHEKLREDAPKNPFSPYGITKLSMEYFLNYYQVKFGMQHDIYRVSNVYGMGQDTSKGLGLINTFLEKIIRGEKIKIFGSGENKRNYIFVKDVAGLLMHSVSGDTTQSGVFNISSNDNITINDAVQKIRSVVDIPFEPEYAESRSSDNSAILLDNTRILSVVPGFRFTSLEDGIRETFQFIKKQTELKT